MVLTFKNLSSCPNLVHAVTTVRFNGTCDFNLADHVGVNRENAIDNRRTLLARLGLPFERLSVSQQVHEINVAAVTVENVGAGCDGWKKGIPATDALVTDLPNTPLMVLSADCPLILVFEPVRQALAVIHASWRCMFGGIIERTVAMLAERFAADPRRMWAGIGPGAGPCCYEVDEKFVATISSRLELLDHVVRNQTRMRYDLWSADVAELVRAGVPAEHIEKMSCCSICDERFFSFRRQKEQAGRFGLLAAIRPT